MNRRLEIDIRHQTWPGRNQFPQFPPSFHQGRNHADISIPSVLLMIGYLTTPVSVTGVSLAEFWAWVRYLAAITQHPDLRVTQAFADLDAHQKTILSDDFGMGTPMLWLLSKLNFQRIVDGRYFLRRISASVGATQRRTAKRGPNKTPDFVARDTNGVWHVVECKGTQSGAGYSHSQVGEKGPPPTGGIAQKQAIVFPRNYTGQRLVCALSIGIEENSQSLLTIVDPKPEEPFTIDTTQMDLAEDASIRGVVAKSLRLAGLERTAEVTASPLGPQPESRRYQRRTAEQQRREFVELRDLQAADELDVARERLDAFGDGFIGRRQEFILPRPVYIDDQPVGRAIISQGIDRDVLEAFRSNVRIEEPVESSAGSWAQMVERTFVNSEERFARLNIGKLFRSEIILD